MDDDSSPDLSWLLANLVKTVPGARSALLLSADGLPTASHGLDDEFTDKLAAMASGMCSLARNIGRIFSGSDLLRQIVTELDDLFLFVSAAGNNSVLAVLTTREADAGVVGHEMTQMVKSVAPFLASQPRTPGVITRLPAPEMPQRLPPAGPS
jgi:predicted regulator of Ras-like GTPase activity (Roadblock/LC7/MglB family)